MGLINLFSIIKIKFFDPIIDRFLTRNPSNMASLKRLLSRTKQCSNVTIVNRIERVKKEELLLPPRTSSQGIDYYVRLYSRDPDKMLENPPQAVVYETVTSYRIVVVDNPNKAIGYILAGNNEAPVMCREYARLCQGRLDEREGIIGVDDGSNFVKLIHRSEIPYRLLQRTLYLRGVKVT